MTAAITPTAPGRGPIDGMFRRKRLTALAIPALLLVYLAYVFVSFDVAGLFGRFRLDNAATLVADSYSFKTHVTRQTGDADPTFAIEGEAKGRYPAGMSPDWVTQGADGAIVDLGGGHVVRYLPDDRIVYDVPDFGPIEIAVVDGVVSSNLETYPDWINASDSRIAITTDAGRVTVTRSKAEVFRYQGGWELFWFTLDSPYYGHGPLAILFGDRIDPDRANIVGAAQDVWSNRMWRHSDVVWAIGETMLMAFLGTFAGAIIALPLAFMAARNLMPFRALRFALRRFFDFVRGVDGLIWTIMLSRAFGPGPLTGTLAIMITDIGSFGKTFSEALENIDQKQVEGVTSTGANPVQRFRFGVIPQVTPVLLSQMLYMFESNTRGATIIGAITGGGIGLLLTQAMQTQKDWEDVAYYVILIILMVFLIDSLSGWLRRKLIKGE